MKYVIKKVLTMIFTLCVVCFLIFGAFYLIPGDPAFSRSAAGHLHRFYGSHRQEFREYPCHLSVWFDGQYQSGHQYIYSLVFTGTTNTGKN